jgi:hypothetical protein
MDADGRLPVINVATFNTLAIPVENPPAEEA